MEIITEGHAYALDNFEEPNAKQRLQFIQKEPAEPGSGILNTVADGTTNEEVLKMLVDRMYYLQGKFPCKENACCITHLEEALMWLEKRTSDRITRDVEGKHLR